MICVILQRQFITLYTVLSQRTGEPQNSAMIHSERWVWRVYAFPHKERSNVLRRPYYYVAGQSQRHKIYKYREVYLSAISPKTVLSIYRATRIIPLQSFIGSIIVNVSFPKSC